MDAKRDVFVDASPASGVGVFNRRHLFLTTLLCLSPYSAARFNPTAGIPILRFRRPSTLSRNPFPVTRHPSPVTRHPLSTTHSTTFVRLFSHPFPPSDRRSNRRSFNDRITTKNPISKLNSAFFPSAFSSRSREISKAISRVLIVLVGRLVVTLWSLPFLSFFYLFARHRPSTSSCTVLV